MCKARFIPLHFLSNHWGLERTYLVLALSGNIDCPVSSIWVLFITFIMLKYIPQYWILSFNNISSKEPFHLHLYFCIWFVRKNKYALLFNDGENKTLYQKGVKVCFLQSKSNFLSKIKSTLSIVCQKCLS